ncbi:hypothetical protein MMC25_007152 [Agyrium rufum]|nr:hypothetical protein [Agyrium rufum]
MSESMALDPIGTPEEKTQSPDIISLRKLANSLGGLGDDSTRQIVWPLFLGSPTPDSTESPSTEAEGDEKPHHPEWRSLPTHKDEDQVRLDVNRSFIYYPSNESEKQLDRRKEELFDVITQVLRQQPMLCYFQGFHDIVQVLLLVLGKEAAVGAVSRLALLRIRDFMLPSLSPSLAHLRLLPAILYAADRELYARVKDTQPYFALAATLTLYAHDIEAYADIARLFDFLLAHEAVVSIYLFAQIILSRRQELFEIPADEPEMLHFTLSKLPKPLNLEDHIHDALVLYETYPPTRLPFRAWSKVSSNSVLKTTRDSTATQIQTLEEGRTFFAKQVAELNREEQRRQVLSLLWKYRRPVSSIGLALTVGIISIILRGSTGESAVTAGWRKAALFVKYMLGGQT